MNFSSCAVGDTCTASQIGSTSAITLTNTGSIPGYVFSAISSDTAHYGVPGNTCPPSGAGLAVGDSCAITVNFTPTAIGATPNGTLAITANTQSSPINIALTGNGIAAMTITPATLLFGSVRVGSSQTGTSTLNNFQNIAVTLDSIGFSGVNAGDFSQSGGTCTVSGTVAAATSSTAPGTCTVEVEYRPSAIGTTESASLVVADSPDITSPHSQPISAGTTLPPVPTPTVTPTSTPVPEILTVKPLQHNFGNKAVGVDSKPAKIKIKNRDKVNRLPVTIVSVRVDQAADYPIVGGNCPRAPAQLAYRKSCYALVACKPPAIGPVPTGTLTVTANVITPPLPVTLDCTGK